MFSHTSLSKDGKELVVLGLGRWNEIHYWHMVAHSYYKTDY